MDRCLYNDVKDLTETVKNCEKCILINSKVRCAKCDGQQKFNVFLVCFVVLTVALNAMLLTNQISNSKKIKSLQDIVDSLQVQTDKKTSVGSTKYDLHVKDEGSIKVPSSVANDGAYEFNDRSLINIESRVKRRARRQKRQKKKRKDYVHVEGTGGQHSPEDHFAGIFNKWKLAEWTQPKSNKTGVVKTVQDEFHLDILRGVLTVKRKGIYLLYSQITLMGQPDQGYYIEQNDKKIASCFLSFTKSSLIDDDGHEHYMSCSTTGIFAFNVNDKIRLRHNKRDAIMALFDANASYFGLVKLK